MQGLAEDHDEGDADADGHEVVEDGVGRRGHVVHHPRQRPPLPTLTSLPYDGRGGVTSRGGGGRRRSSRCPWASRPCTECRCAGCGRGGSKGRRGPRRRLQVPRWPLGRRRGQRRGGLTQHANDHPLGYAGAPGELGRELATLDEALPLHLLDPVSRRPELLRPPSALAHRLTLGQRGDLEKAAVEEDGEGHGEEEEEAQCHLAPFTVHTGLDGSGWMRCLKGVRELLGLVEAAGGDDGRGALADGRRPLHHLHHGNPVLARHCRPCRQRHQPDAPQVVPLEVFPTSPNPSTLRA